MRISRCRPLNSVPPVPPCHWEIRPEPVLSRGVPGQWDSVDVLNPAIVKRDGVYFNFYSGYDGQTWHTGLATSPDGIRWTKKGRVLSPDTATWEGDYIAANGTALLNESQFWYWYQAGSPPRIGLARSADGQSGRSCPRPCWKPGRAAVGTRWAPPIPS